jgi:hypothetical protein
MKFLDQQILIEQGDHPQTIDRALQAGADWGQENLPPDDAWLWRHTEANAWEAVRDGFSIWDDKMYNPGGEAQIYMSPRQFELSLVVHGLGRLAEGDLQEYDRVNEVLSTIDRVRPTQPIS